MNTKQWTAALTAIVLGTSSLSAFAQPGPHGPHGHGPAPRAAHGGPQYKHPAPPPRHKAHPGARPAQPGHPHGMPPGQAKRLGAGPQHNWVKGTRVPPQFRTSHYVVNDWHRHGLKRPPRGHQWVQYGGDYLLVAIATGVIAQLILGH
ncbi:RcnB family protein [Comamonas sp.]